MTKIDFYWHCHHDILLEFVYDFAGRLKYIEENKPEGEQELRKRLFKKVRGKLPVEVIKTGKAYYKAREAYFKTIEAYYKAGEAYNKAWKAYDKAIEDNMAEILKLHAEECPDCPWDGKTIFPSAGGK